MSLTRSSLELRGCTTGVNGLNHGMNSDLTVGLTTQISFVFYGRREYIRKQRLKWENRFKIFQVLTTFLRRSSTHLKTVCVHAPFTAMQSPVTTIFSRPPYQEMCEQQLHNFI